MRINDLIWIIVFLGSFLLCAVLPPEAFGIFAAALFASFITIKNPETADYTFLVLFAVLLIITVAALVSDVKITSQGIILMYSALAGYVIARYAAQEAKRK